MKIKHFFTILLLLFIFIICNMLSYSNKVFAGLQDNIFRLHILANSDTQEDQNLKLKVRDSIIDYMETLNTNFSSKEEALLNVSNHLNEIQAIAEKTIKANGFSYSVSIEIGNFFFPTKHYGNISLPAGNYDALRVNIGNAAGQNWWCSLFPPLCFIDISAGYLENDDSKILEENLSDEEFMLVSSSSPDVKLKFRILEILNNQK